ncbi:hypothetical protein FF041_17980 [Streptomyces jumonjinensis]|uniref:Glycoside hydrolase family 65 C-terminal domain-containing protein n=1 Tax=Streptomyces jumonjinensis TaxID=1945 RepID=A0A646KID8_STRJU|nr:hypothetical protein [Streptomyces jumonjinensis]
MRYQGHWGVRLRLRDGQLHMSVPDLDRAPVGVELPDRTVSVAPGRPATSPCRATDLLLELPVRPARVRHQGRDPQVCDRGAGREGKPTGYSLVHGCLRS